MQAALHPVSEQFITDSVSRAFLKGGLPVLVVRNSFADAIISLFGAQLLSYRPCGGSEWLWVSNLARLDQTCPIRGGIPICWPWFGRNPKLSGAPAHGFARTQLWQLDAVSDTSRGTTLSLFLSDDDVSPDYWPFAFELQLDVTIGHQLELSLTGHNCDHHPWRFSTALHSYFNVGDVSKTTVYGVGGRYRDKLNGQSVIDTGPLQVSPPLDRIYPGAAPQVVMAAAQHSILLDQAGMDSVVVWHPGTRLPKDMDATTSGSMLCVETAALGSEGITLAPGKAHQLKLVVSRQA
ncbi:glucose-6-phosphate 1-epimerase [Ferrimonas sediminum]|uniref:Putative glucose-6-phosphate 1-epimerase n=1 Tax=Ferrimonas sediminum TaxID=718193 RepID=A0A1G8RYM9_9GAMM|nr:D-hexose-6-phosphate mutarotase [Ferrimonas sediminum]SDJ22057.1 glucose-6-phosphate 1-epimerase [Ferrimonas sediminum]